MFVLKGSTTGASPCIGKTTRIAGGQHSQSVDSKDQGEITSERTDDPTHSEYRWTDHEAELHRQQQNNQSGSTGKQFSLPEGQNNVPDLPPGVDLDANVKEARRMYNPFTFVGKVKTDGDWDFKKYNKNTEKSPYEDGGNFHYGVTSKAFGFPEWLSKRAAGAYQIDSNTSTPEWGGPAQLTLGDKTKWPDGLLYKYMGILSYPYGDDPADQRKIEQGFRYYDDHYNEGVDHTTRE